MATKDDIREIQKSLNVMMKLQRETINLLIKPVDTQRGQHGQPELVRRELNDNTREAEILLERLTSASGGRSDTRNTQANSGNSSRGSSNKFNSSIYMVDIIPRRPLPDQVMSKMWVVLVALAAVVWEEPIPIWSSKVVLRMLLYSVALLVVVLSTNKVTAELDNVLEPHLEGECNDFILPDLDNEPEDDNSVPITHETSIVSCDESDGPLHSPLTPIRRGISVNPARGGVSRKLIQTMISTPPYKSQKPYMDRGSRKAVFIIDSGASHHVVNDISILDDIIYKGPREDMGRVGYVSMSWNCSQQNQPGT
jgi:hypothetical protein